MGAPAGASLGDAREMHARIHSKNKQISNYIFGLDKSPSSGTFATCQRGWKKKETPAGLILGSPSPLCPLSLYAGKDWSLSWHYL